MLRLWAGVRTVRRWIAVSYDHLSGPRGTCREVAQQRGDSALRRRVVTDYLRHLDSAFAYSERLSLMLFNHEIPLVLLLHANELNADYLDTVLSRLHDRGYRFVTIESALKDSAYRSADTYVGPAGMSWLFRWAFTRGVQPPTEPREQRYSAELAGVP